MSKPIGAIVWPSNPSDSVSLLLKYMVRVLETVGFSFAAPLHDPIILVKRSLAKTASDEERRSALTYWWNVVEEKGIRNFESRDALIARLAVSLLSPTEAQASEFGDQLSWFLEVLGFLELDVDKAISIMEEHFEFRAKRWT